RNRAVTRRVPNARNTRGLSGVVPRTGRASFPWRNKLDRRPRMFKTLMISAAITALMASGALAQADKPADSGKFIASQSTDQWVFSKFKGTDVLGPDNAHIRNVNDMLFDKQGKMLAPILRVGGVLAHGVKNVRT